MRELAALAVLLAGCATAQSATRGEPVAEPAAAAPEAEAEVAEPEVATPAERVFTPPPASAAPADKAQSCEWLRAKVATAPVRVEVAVALPPGVSDSLDPRAEAQCRRVLGRLPPMMRREASDGCDVMMFSATLDARALEQLCRSREVSFLDEVRAVTPGGSTR